MRDIIILPDKRLRLVSKPVAKIDAATRKLVEDMFETMYDAPGIGLAAIQVGEPRRVVTMDLAKKDEPKEPQVFINPEIVWTSDEKTTHEEGCLSIPEYYEEVERPAQVKVRYLDLDGKPQEVEADGLLATCIQHEIDHLDGVLFIDHISKLKRDRVIKKFTKAAKLGSARRSKRGEVIDAASPDLHGHAGVRGADAARARGAGPRHRRGLYARAEARRPARAWSSRRRRSSARRGTWACRCSRPRSLKSADAQAAFARARRRRRGGGRLWPDPAEADPRCAAARLLQSAASLLPRWRGAAPIHRAIMAGDAETGVTVMKMDEGLDTGPMAMAERVAIGADMTAGELHDALARRGADLMARALAALERGTLQFTPQPADGVTYAAKIDKAETRIDWTQAVARGARPHPRAVAVSRRLVRDGKREPRQGAAHDQGRGQRRARHGARRPPHRRLRRRRGPHRRIAARRRQPMKAEEFLRGTPVRAGARAD